MNKYKYVIFDLDGTLLNTTQGIKASVRYTTSEMGLKPLSDEELESIIGPPIGSSLQRIYKLTDDKRDEAVEIFRNRYKNHDLLKAYIYDGAYELCNYLKQQDIMMAIATYKRYDYAKMISAHFRLDEYMCFVEGSDFASKMTKVDILRKTLELGGIERSECVMVGDTLYDGQAANHLDIDFIAVTYGYGYQSEQELSQTDYVLLADSPKDITAFFKASK